MECWGDEPRALAGCRYVALSAGRIKTVSCLYKAIRGDMQQPLERLRSQWEEDLGKQIPEGEWDKILERTPKAFRNARFKLINYYVLHRAYLTPARIRQHFGAETAVCPRCREREAHILHMFWNCPVLQAFWEEIRWVVGDLIKKELPQAPEHFLLGRFPHTAKNKVMGKFQDLAYVLAKREIARNWKAPGGPRITTWKKELERWAGAEGRLLLRETSRGIGKLERARAWESLVCELVANGQDSNSGVSTPRVAEPEQEVRQEEHAA